MTSQDRKIPNYSGPDEGMTLYCKAGPDGTSSIGDCPFCHAVRLVLEELHLEYELIPATSETKPKWLLDSFEGKMPALRHGNECITESSVIMDYLLHLSNDKDLAQTNSNESATAGLFPAIATFLKHRPDNDEVDLDLGDKLKQKLQQLNDHLVGKQFWNGNVFTRTDCILAPQLYHLKCGIAAFQKQMELTEFPNVFRYMENLFHRPSFRSTVYPAETVEWGWSNARK